MNEADGADLFFLFFFCFVSFGCDQSQSAVSWEM